MEYKSLCQRIQRIYFHNSVYSIAYNDKVERGMRMFEEFFRQRLAQLRLAKGVSARDMSLSLGQSESYINKIENGKAFPSMQIFFYICQYFDITPEDFFRQENRYPTQLRELMTDLQQLNESQLAALQEIVKGLKR